MICTRARGLLERRHDARRGVREKRDDSLGGRVVLVAHLPHGVAQMLESADQQPAQLFEPLGNARRGALHGFGQRERRHRQVEVGERPHGVGQSGRAGGAPIIGLARQPGCELPQVSGMRYVTAMLARFERQWHARETFLLYVPEHGLDEFQAFARRVFLGPAAQEQWSARRGEPPQTRAAQSTGRVEEFDCARLAIGRIGGEHGLVVERSGHSVASRKVARFPMRANRADPARRNNV